MRRIENANMALYSTFKLGGFAKELVIVENEEELQEILKEVEDNKVQNIFIGNGSNTVFIDPIYEGVVIKLGEGFDYVKIEGNLLRAGCATLLSKTAKEAAKAGLAGMEFASGIPGSIGGAVFMNAGAYGPEMKEIVHSVKVMSRDGKKVEVLKGEDLDFSYRNSRLQSSGEIALEVTLNLYSGKSEDIFEEIRVLTEKRNSKQPINFPSCGSFFKRPKGDYAGRLIESCGLKGATIGGVQVSEKHSGFIINHKGGTVEDLLRLKEKVQREVYEKTGFKLEPEVRLVSNKE